MEGDQVDDLLIEMAYRWADIEERLPTWFQPPPQGDDEGEPDRIGERLDPNVRTAFRVEALYDTDGDPCYALLFDVERQAARDAAQAVRDDARFLTRVIEKLSGGRRYVQVRVVSSGVPHEGQVCGRPGQPPPRPHVDVADVPAQKPNSNVPLVEKDGYWLTPIEVPFYDALRETGLIFAVQPWIQGVERRYRLDFLIFYDGGMIAVELDGHETHKRKEQRARDAKRDRWFVERGVRTLRWTGSEVTRNPQECVRELLSICRGSQARP